MSLGPNLEMDDGTVWFWSPELEIWTGWEPGEDGCWTVEDETFRKWYPEAGRD